MNKNSNNIIVWAIVAVVLFSGASFYGGMKYASAKTTASAGVAAQTRASRFGQGSTTGTRIGTRTGAPVVGSVVSKDATSLTVKLIGGGSQIAFYDASTTVMKTTPAAISDLNVGDQVMINGTPNPDGSVNAQSVQTGIDTNRFRGAQPQAQGTSPVVN